MKKVERFDSVPLTDTQRACVKEITNVAKELEQEIENFVVDPRYKAIALTKLEEVVMFANKGISRGKTK